MKALDYKIQQKFENLSKIIDKNINMVSSQTQGIGQNLEMMGENMNRCAETMQKQISSILIIIIFFKDLVIPKDIKDQVKK